MKESTVHNTSHIPYAVEEEQLNIVDETVIYFGMLIGVWGHCITDCIKRAWFFNSEEYREKYSGLRVVYIAHKDSLHKNFLDVLSKLGIDIRSFTEIKEPTRFAKIIVPDSSFFLDDERIDHFTIEYRECIDKIKEGYQKGTASRKIYYSHRNVRWYNNDIGEEKIERYLEDNGFEIIHPEKMGFDEQLKLLSQCSVFAASDGSTSHNSIFLPEDAEVIIIPRSPYLTFHQLALNELYEKQRIYYIDSSLSILCKGDRPTRGPFFYYVSSNLVEHIEGKQADESEEYLKSNFGDFKKYMNYGLYVENNRKFTAFSPYTQIAFYYYNRYLFENRARVRIVQIQRGIEIFFMKVMKKLSRALDREGN